MMRNIQSPVVALFLLATCMIVVPAGAMINPSAGYCMELGYEYTNTIGTDGSMTGSCLLPGDRSVDAWQFLQGMAAPEKSYCREQGLEVRTVNDPAVCGMLGSTCAVCVRADGSTQEVTAMMGLDFREKICSGDICCDPATDATCAIGQEPPGTGEAVGTTSAELSLFGITAALIIAGIFGSVLKNKSSEPEKKNP
jgi:putative hemolysin